MERESFIKWFAGFFDGEGSIGIQLIQTKTGLVFQPKIQIVQQNFEILNEIKKELQINNKIQTLKLVNIGKYKSKIPVNQLVVSNIKDCLRITNLILPYSLVKQKQLKIFKEFLEIMGDTFSRKNRKLLVNKYTEFYPNISDKNKQKIMIYIK